MIRTLAILSISMFSLCVSSNIIGQSSYRGVKTQIDKSEQEIIRAINTIRAGGCRCGRTKFEPASKVSWNNQLQESTFQYAKHMSTYTHFSHVGRDGSKVGDRIDRTGYYWRLVGENIGEGHDYFHEVLKDWMLSPSHCELIMNPNMTHVAVSRYNKYWVLHMATPMPVDSKRGNVRYKN